MVERMRKKRVGHQSPSVGEICNLAHDTVFAYFSGNKGGRKMVHRRKVRSMNGVKTKII